MKKVAGLASFTLLVMLLLGLFKGALLFHMEEYSLFSTDPLWLQSFFEQPAGFFYLAGAFLTQFCAVPLLGALLLALLLVALQMLVKETFGCGELVAYLPSLMLVLFIAHFDYSVYMLHSFGLLFAPVLGAMLSVACLLLYRKALAGRKSAPLWLALLMVAGYPLFGFYVLFGGLLIAVEAFRSGKKPVGTVLAMAVAGFAVVFFCSYSNLVYPRINRRFCYLAGLPYRDFVRNTWQFFPLILCGLSLLLLPLLQKVRRDWMAYAAAFALVLGFTNWDPNFHSQARMEQAVAKSDWDKVLRIAKKDKDPTRIQVLYRNIALYQKGQLTERMFTFPDGAAPLKTGAGDAVTISYVCGPAVAFYSGLMRTCERWTMELSVTTVKNLYYYKNQAKVALFTGDYDLARKYIRTIAQSWFQRRWVAHYGRLAEHPELMAEDAEARRLLPLLDFDSNRLDYVGPVETGIIKHYVNAGYTNEAVYEWHMAMLMTSKMEYEFLMDFLDHYEKVGGNVTTGEAQAAALFAGMSGQRDMLGYVAEILSNRQSVLRDFSRFGNRLNVTPDLEAPGAGDWFKENFGPTYWYYYYFTSGLATN